MGQQSKGQGAEWFADQQRDASRKARRLARPTQTQKDGAWRKPVHTPNSVTADAGMASLGVRGNPLSNNPIALAVDAAGNFGYIPSSLEKKTVIGDYTVDMAQWLAQPLKMFTYDGDPTGRVSVGWIAESLDAAGLKEFVVYSPNGTIQGVRVETLIAGLHSAYVQSRSATQARLAKSLRQTKTITGMTALAVGGTKQYTVVWDKPFADADYTVVSDVYSSSGLPVSGATAALVLGSQTEAQCVVQVNAGVALLTGQTLFVQGHHA